ncbi:hypothetical protein FI667_g16176, partial [Globisporangium splendens]
MSNKIQQLEHEIAEMEERLANVKVTVDIEREAWKKSYLTGKKGTKWKGAAREQPAASSKTSVENSSSESKGDVRRDSEVDMNIMPSYWDALELAQYLQTKRLTAFAQVVICEQITGKALLCTAPGKMRLLFQDITASNSDPNWKLFLQECAKLQMLQKKLEKSSNMVSAQSDANDIAQNAQSDSFVDKLNCPRCGKRYRQKAHETSDADAQASSKYAANCYVLELWNALSSLPRINSRWPAKYKLDPDLYQANGATIASCFYNGAAASGASNTRKNLMGLQEYISVKSLHRLSLTSRSWFDAIHQSSLADPLWGFHLLRLWRRSEDDELFLHEIGVLKKPERPQRMLMKLTRQVGRAVLENMKVLLNPENWHLATPMNVVPALTLQVALWKSMQDMQSHGQQNDRQPPPPKADARADMFEQIAIIYNKKGEIVAVRAQELIRPIVEDQMLTDILHGMRPGAFATAECRRLRLFSASNRLPFDQWHMLSANSRVVFDFFWGSASSANSTTTINASTAGTLLPRVWHQKILERMQKNMQQRLLGKESIQQVLKALNDRNGPPQALVALEKFLTLCHTTMDSSNAASSAQTAKKRKEQQQQQHSPTLKTHT